MEPQQRTSRTITSTERLKATTGCNYKQRAGAEVSTIGLIM